MLYKIVNTIITLTFISLYVFLVWIAPTTWAYFGLVLISALITQYLCHKERVKEKEFFKKHNLNY